MFETHKVIIIPGLGGNNQLTTIATKSWRQHGLEPVICSAEWYDADNFPSKLKKFKDLIDKYSSNGLVSVVGCSAGASLALNLFIERSNKINKAISVCGRLKKGNQKGLRSFTARTKASSAFAQSVEFFENQESSLNEVQRKNIMTVRPLFGDELVPSNTASLIGANNITIPTIEHSFSIYMALSFFSKPLINFLRS